MIKDIRLNVCSNLKFMRADDGPLITSQGMTTSNIKGNITFYILNKYAFQWQEFDQT